MGLGMNSRMEGRGLSMSKHGKWTKESRLARWMQRWSVTRTQAETIGEVKRGLSKAKAMAQKALLKNKGEEK